MKKVCVVCGQEHPMIVSKIAKGVDNDWICRECLDKAGLSVMKFQSKKLTTAQVIVLIDKNTYPQKFTQTPVEQTPTQSDPIVQNAPSLHCPRCKRNNLEVVSDVNSKGLSGGKIFLFGALGLSGAGKTTTKHYWICKDCGFKFEI